VNGDGDLLLARLTVESSPRSKVKRLGHFGCAISPGRPDWDEDDGKVAVVDQLGSRVAAPAGVAHSDHDGVRMTVPGELGQ
jgi:hypothetical protein